MNVATQLLFGDQGQGSGGHGDDWLVGWNRRKKFTVASTTNVESIIELTISSQSGTDTTTTVFLNGNVRSDWGDVRFTLADGLTRLPYGILRRAANTVLVAINLSIVQNGDFYIYYDGPASDLFKIIHLTDIHYDPAEPALDNRDDSLIFIDNAVARATTYLPNLFAKGGDDVGDATTSESPRLALFQDVLDHVALAAAVSSSPEIMNLAPGNHDFDNTTFPNTLAVLTQPWMEAGALYGSKDVGPYLIVSLDANYTPDTQTHLSDSHQGFGYVNTNQLTWLTAVLASATKPVIIFCHQPLSEMDTDQFTLSKAVYHTQNRTAIRAILEASGKVICCIHGHVHYSRNNVIAGIPYITCTNIGNTGQFGEQPAVNTGKWTLIDLDASSKTIRVRTEAVVSGTVQLIYEQYFGFGITQFDNVDVSNSPSTVYGAGWPSTQFRTNLFIDPTNAYVNNDDFQYKYPVNVNLAEPALSDTTIKIVGRTNSPNVGRSEVFLTTVTGKIRIKFDVRVTTVKTKTIKFGNSNVLNSPAFRIDFNNSGNFTTSPSGGAVTLFAYSIDVWYKIEIVADIATDTYLLYVNDILQAPSYAFLNNVTSIDRAEIATETGNVFIDNLRTYTYADTVISGFQSEEV